MLERKEKKKKTEIMKAFQRYRYLDVTYLDMYIL